MCVHVGDEQLRPDNYVINDNNDDIDKTRRVATNSVDGLILLFLHEERNKKVKMNNLVSEQKKKHKKQ